MLPLSAAFYRRVGFYRLLVKKTKSPRELMPAAACVFPYDGAKEMLLVDEIDSKGFLAKLFEAIYDELYLRS